MARWRLTGLESWFWNELRLRVVVTVEEDGIRIVSERDTTDSEYLAGRISAKLGELEARHG